MPEWRFRQDALDSPEELGIVLKCQPAHQDRARVDLLMRRLRRKVGKEIHRPHHILLQERIKGEYILLLCQLAFPRGES